MRISWALVLLVGCAEGMTVAVDAPPGDAPLPPPPHDARARDAGAPDAPPACSAAVETLSGRATYIAGSIAVTTPAAEAPGFGGLTCMAWLDGSGFEAGVVATGPVDVAAGTIFSRQADLVSATPGVGCSYRLRVLFVGGSMQMPCDNTRDYLLTVP
jgi:hypothetical protein